MSKRILWISLSLLISITGFSGAYTAGETLKSYGILSGDQYGNLNEEKTLNRADMAVLLASMNGKALEAKRFKMSSTFSDIPKGVWYAPYVAYAEAMGWTHGVGDGKYAPLSNVTKKEAAAFLMNVIGKKYDYTNILSEANSVGIKNGLSGDGAILRKDIFAAMLDTLYLVPEGKNQSLGMSLGYFVAPVVAENPIAVESLKMASKTKMVVNFNKDVTNRSNIKINVKRFFAEIPNELNWNDSKQSVAIVFNSDLLTGVYEVTIFEDGKELSSHSILVEDSRIDSIQITSPSVNVVTKLNESKGYASYTIYDQYGKDITSQIAAADLMFTSTFGTARGGGGAIIIDSTSTLQTFAQRDRLNVSVVERKTGKSINATLPIGLTIASLTEIKLLPVNPVQNGTSQFVYIPYQAFDSFGIPTQNYEIIAGGLLDMNYLGVQDSNVELIAPGNAAGIKIEVVRDYVDYSKAAIRVTPGSVTLSADMDIVVTANTYLGRGSAINIKVLK